MFYQYHGEKFRNTCFGAARECNSIHGRGKMSESAGSSCEFIHDS